MSLTFGPINRVSLCFEGAENMIRTILDNLVVDAALFRAYLRTRLDVDVRHLSLPSGRSEGGPEPLSVRANNCTNEKSADPRYVCLSPEALPLRQP